MNSEKKIEITYKIRPSSPADQKMHGLSATVASRFTRCVWQLHFQHGDDWSVARFTSNTVINERKFENGHLTKKKKKQN